jgi:hypothetical protein
LTHDLAKKTRGRLKKTGAQGEKRGSQAESGAGGVSCRYKPNLYTLAECLGYAFQQGKRVPIVISVLQAADGRSRRADALRKLALGETRTGPQAVDLPGNFSIESLLLIGFGQRRVGSNVAVVEKPGGVRLEPPLGSGNSTPA